MHIRPMALTLCLLLAVASLGGFAPPLSAQTSPTDLYTHPEIKVPAARAFWVQSDVLALPPDLQASGLELHSSRAAGLLAGQAPDQRLPLSPLHLTWGERFPAVPARYAAYPLYRLSTQTSQTLRELVQSQLLVRGVPASSSEMGVQLAPLLDAALAYTGSDLGLSWRGRRPHFRLWAPTAQRVALVHLNASGQEQARENLQPAEGGTWTLLGRPEWYNSYYRYEVTVYRPDTGRVETHAVTDPYSVSLALNSTASQMVRLDDPALVPRGWSRVLRAPGLLPEHPEDRVLYELHVRDFSQADLSVPERDRGKYTAFTHWNSDGMRHLRGLAAAGLSHVHLLPVFDIATIEEEASRQAQPVMPSPLPPDGPEAQAAIGSVRALDAYNWGYDPLHYGVPEGSYSTQPQGSHRILEFRQMVQSLARAGLGTVLDVVYNHTHATGTGDKSVLDKIVPGYYYRLDASGQVQQSSCCPDTASEHRMMEKLMIDTLVRWAREYKITGFRFDLMGHHTQANLRRVRAALDALTPARDGIDGKRIYLYGEGWKFGSLDALRPDAMHQTHAAGSGVGTFNDRLRDSARGGNFDHATRSDQGWATGLYLDPNHSLANQDTPVEPAAQQRQLLNYTENIRLGMAGNLRDLSWTGADGRSLSGATLDYRGQRPAGYTLDPQESINYVSAHDNYTLWDQIAAKAPYQVSDRSSSTATPRERMQMQMLALSTVLLGQGVPFLHAGSEILRSKSGDGDSYDSGDHFNRLDWRYLSNGWGQGLPGEWRNAAEWPFWQPRLADPHFVAGRAEMVAALAQVQRLLMIRRSSPLFRLRTGAEIQQRLHFLNTGAGQLPGLVVLHLDDRSGPDLDPERDEILVLLNPAPTPLRFAHPQLQGAWKLYQIKGQAILAQALSLPVEEAQVTALPLGPQPLPTAQGSIALPARSLVILQR
ncbi:MAG: pullulanase-type alpha-1,6-glucosidase [Candidatus Sericytochromatia bacterium]